MGDLDRRIKEIMEERGYEVDNLVTYIVPGTGYLTQANCKYPPSSGSEDVVVYLIDGKTANPLVAQEVLAEHLRGIGKAILIMN